MNTCLDLSGDKEPQTEETPKAQAPAATPKVSFLRQPLESPRGAVKESDGPGLERPLSSWRDTKSKPKSKFRKIC